jgi:predicted amidohydrolase
MLSPKEYKIVILQLTTHKDYNKNLNRLIKYIKENRGANLIVAPEVFLTGFDYENFDRVVDFYDIAIKRLLEVVGDEIFIFTIIKRENRGVVNQAVVIHNHKIVYTQNKYKLFRDETKYFLAGREEDFLRFSIDGVSFGIIICFELRFKELWKRLEGVDIIVVPAMWGRPRKVHLEVLARALAIVNQCFVVVSNSANLEMAKGSLVASPWGDLTKNDRLSQIGKIIDLKEVTKVRRLIKMR